MKKADFKKMAQMGMACGMLFAAHAPINGEIAPGSIVAKSCGAGSCGANKPSPRTTQYSNSGCNGYGQPQYGNSSCGGNQGNRGRDDGYTADNSMDTTTQQGGVRIVTDSELRSQLTTQRVRDLYERLSPEAKAFAQRLVGLGRNADQAVDEAAQSTANRRAAFTQGGTSGEVSIGEGFSSPSSVNTNPYGSTSSMQTQTYPGSMQGQTAPSYNTGSYGVNPYGTQAAPTFTPPTSTPSYNPQEPMRR